MVKNNLKYYKYELDMKELNNLGAVLFVVMLIIMYFIGYDYGNITEYNLLVLFVLMVLWLMFHEVLHGIGFALFKEVDKKNIVFGMALEKGVFYCMCKQKISKKVIFTSLLFPFTIIGVITLILGVVINSWILVYLSVLNIVGSIGDIVMSVYFFRCPNDVMYLDLDDCTSFTVLGKNDLSIIRVPGVKLISSGNYDNSMKAIDKRRIVISKMSFIILLIMFIVMSIIVLGGEL